MKFGRYELQEKLAAGGMGEVFRAQALGVEGFAKPIAVKRIYPHLSADATYRALFIREAKVTAHLVHPNIVQVYDLGEEEGQLFIAMELIRGADLQKIRDVLSEHDSAVPPDLLAVVAFDVLEALDFAHTLTDDEGNPRHLVHRDVSPQNVLINNSAGFAKLCDFGVARATTGSADMLDGKMVGKFRYVAPEQAIGEKLDGRADLYSLGVVLFEAAAGRPFLEGFENIELVSRVCDGKVERLRDARPDLPDAFLDLVDKALNPNPNDRYASAADFRSAVEEYLTRYDPRQARTLLRELARSATAMESPGDPRRPSSELSSDLEEKTERWTQLVDRAAQTVAAAPLAVDGDFEETTGRIDAERMRRILEQRKAQLAEAADQVPDAMVPAAAAEDESPPPDDFAHVTTHRMKNPGPGDATPVLPRPGHAERDRRRRIGVAGVIATLLAAAWWFWPADSERSMRRPRRPGATQAPGAVPKPRAKQAPMPARDPGFITLLTRPRARVFINGEPVGRTPLRRHRIEPGVHKVVLRAGRGRSKAITIRVGPGKTVTKKLRL